MKESSTTGLQRLPARLATAVLVISLLFLSYPGPLPPSSRGSLHDEPIETETLEGLGKLGAALVFYRGTSNKAPVFLLADVAVDEDFVDQVGDGWEAHVYEMLEAANSLLAPVGLNIIVDSIQHWHSDDAQDYISSQLKSAEEQVERVPEHLFLAITGQDTVKYDGFALESGSRMIVQFYPEHQRRNPLLIAHEVGHLLEARHHEEEEKCTGHGCIMDKRGYAHATTWCEHHQRGIQEYIASRLAM